MSENTEVKYQTVGSVYRSGVKSEAKDTIDTGWKNPPKLVDMKEDFRRAQQAHDPHVKQIQSWLDALHATGKYGVKKVAGRSAVAPKLIRKSIEWKAPSLTEPFLSNKKLIEVSPRSWEDVESSRQNETLLNYQLKNKINLVHLMDAVTCRMETEGTAILKPSWVTDRSVIRKEEKVYGTMPQPELALAYDQIMQQLQQNPDMINELSEEMEKGLQHYAETGEAVAYYVEEIKEVEELRTINNHPDVDVCDNESVFPDPSCKGNMKRCKFIVHTYESTLSELKEAGIYENLTEVERYVLSTEDKKQSHESKDAHDISRKTFDVYEYWGYWDVNNDGVLSAIVATWVGDTLIQLELSPYSSGKLPFIFIRLNTFNKDSFFGEAEAELIADNQQILGAVLRGAIDLLGRSSNGQIGTVKGFLDATNRQKYMNGEPYEFGVDKLPDQSVYMHKFPELPNSVNNMIDFANNDADSMTGTQAFSQGVNSNSLGPVATGVKSAVSAAARRDAAILRRIAQGLVELSYFFVELNGMFLTEKDVVRLTNKEFQAVDPDNLNGDFDLVLDISTAEADAANIQNLSMLLQVGQTSLPFEWTKRILISIARLARLYELEQFLIDYVPEPDPIKEQMNQIMLEREQLNNEKLRAEIELDRAEAQVKLAEVNVRGARTESIIADADSKSVSTYKEINGNTHQEKLDLLAKQNRNQNELEDRKHLNTMDGKRMDHDNGLRRSLADATIAPKSE